MNIIIFSANIGHGHNQVAQAISDELRLHGHTVQRIDALEFVSPFLSKVLLESYLKLLRYTPSIYGHLYQLTEAPTFFDFSAIINNLFCTMFTKLLSQFKPDAIICTHSFPAGLLSALKVRLDIDVPLFVVITDYTVHYAYVHPAVDTYVIASPKLSYLLKHIGVEESQIAPLGIPLRCRFDNPPCKEKARHLLRLFGKPTLLLMGGGLGMGPSVEMVRLLDNYLDGLQLLVITGKNDTLHRELLASRFGSDVHIAGYVENVETYMAAADLLVTKPGGVTCAEALAMGLPMAVVSPIPGQEFRNASFLVEQQVAIQLDVNYLSQKLVDLVGDELRLSYMSNLARRLAKPKATAHLVELLQGLKN